VEPGRVEVTVVKLGTVTVAVCTTVSPLIVTVVGWRVTVSPVRVTMVVMGACVKVDTVVTSS
jgi:hypothetical protein